MSDVVKVATKANPLRKFNNFLTLVAVFLAIYVMVAPLLPEITWWVGEHTPLQAYGDNEEAVQAAAVSPPVSQEKTLFIPSLGLTEKIYEGGLEQLKNGVLRRAQTSTPDKGSNTVLVGHRFAYGARGVFYHLDKVKIGDTLTVHWEGKSYEYAVEDILVVPPTQVSVEEPTEDSILTVYTCTPLWTAKDRLVLRARLQGGEQ